MSGPGKARNSAIHITQPVSGAKASKFPPRELLERTSDPRGALIQTKDPEQTVANKRHSFAKFVSSAKKQVNGNSITGDQPNSLQFTRSRRFAKRKKAARI